MVFKGRVSVRFSDKVDKLVGSVGDDLFFVSRAKPGGVSW